MQRVEDGGYDGDGTNGAKEDVQAAQASNAATKGYGAATLAGAARGRVCRGGGKGGRELLGLRLLLLLLLPLLRHCLRAADRKIVL